MATVARLKLGPGPASGWGRIARGLLASAALWGCAAASLAAPEQVAPEPPKPRLDLAGVTIGMPLGKALDALGSVHSEWRKAIQAERPALMKKCPIEHGAPPSYFDLARIETERSSKTVAAAMLTCRKSEAGALEVAQLWLLVRMDAESNSNLPKAADIQSSLLRRHGDALAWEENIHGGFYLRWFIGDDGPWGDKKEGQQLSASMLSDGFNGASTLNMHLWRGAILLNPPKEMPRARQLSGYDSPY